MHKTDRYICWSRTMMSHSYRASTIPAVTKLGTILIFVLVALIVISMRLTSSLCIFIFLSSGGLENAGRLMHVAKDQQGPFLSKDGTTEYEHFDELLKFL